MLEERFVAGFQADGVHHRLALHAAQACLDHVPIAGVDHHRHPCDVGLRHREIEEALHRGRTIGHAFVHVDVDDLGAVLHLLTCDVEGLGVVAGLDETSEPGGARHVGPFADVDEQAVVVDEQRFQSREFQTPPACRHGSWFRNPGTFGESVDVLGCGAAAAADEVDEATIHEVADGVRHLLGGFVVLTELVR